VYNKEEYNCMKHWYIVQVVSGNELKIKDEIERSVLENGLVDFFGEIVVPNAKKNNSLNSVEEINGIDSDINLFPGYILVKIEPVVEIMHLIKSINRVVKFLGDASCPTMLEDEEVDKIFSQIRGEVSVAVKDIAFEVGREVEIAAGPFMGFSGLIQSIDDLKGKLTVVVSIFGRATPVEIFFNQVKI
jgi:transcriptional antiterminator NusG